tara:strand:+ start:5546 stop:5737 length:192 start_codon:yes stop_codon:yes gene_type:complete
MDEATKQKIMELIPLLDNELLNNLLNDDAYAADFGYRVRWNLIRDDELVFVNQLADKLATLKN